MSSPGPSHAPHPHPSSGTSSTRPKPKLPAQGITAGAEDAKYRAKYYELKKKVKDIEADNDKLHAKTLQAKRNIQRMRIERAVLYERLSHPPSPRVLERQPVPMHTAPIHHYGPPAPHVPPRGHYRDPPEPSMVVVDPNDPVAVDHYRSLGATIRRIVGPDNHTIHVAEMPVVPGQHPAPVPVSAHTSRHTTHLDVRHGHAHAQPYPSSSLHHPEPPRVPGHRRSHSNSYGHSPGASHAHAHSHSHSHSRSRSRSNHPSAHAPPVAGYPPESPLESLPPSYHDPRGEYVPSERRSHRGDDYPPPPSHMQAPAPRGHTPPYGAHSPPPSPRGSSRIHNHQRLGPGTNINNIGQPEREHDREVRDRDRVQEWERERDRRLREREEMGTRAPTPPFASRTRSGANERDAYAARAYEPRAYPEDVANGGGHGGSRSLTPHSRSRSGSAIAYPADDGSARYYEREYESRASASRYMQRGPSDVDTRRPAEEMRRTHSTSDIRATDAYSDVRRGRSDAESDVDMEDVPRHERDDA